MEIGKLTDVDPRTAWPHEANHFTPWLAGNIDRLSEVLGLKLELEGTEVAVENFSADILARDVATGDRVLIENQLGATDHKHLGQIMTYLAGLEAKTIIWIATDFCDPHLSAIKWLNDHTVEEFSFFAIRLRAVKIGDSPIAPIFDVVARPNEWEKHLQAVVRNSDVANEIAKFREDFWNAYLARYPEDAALGIAPKKISSAWLSVDKDSTVIITLYVGKNGAGAFVRGPKGSNASNGDALAKIFEPYREQLEQELGAKYSRVKGSFFYPREKKLDLTDKANWPAAIDWLHATGQTYLASLRNVLQDAK